MARGFAFKSDDGSVVSTLIVGDRVAKRMADREPGLYRVATRRDGLRVYFDIGKRIPNPAKEADRLIALGSERAKVAATGMPGIQGMQGAADASTQAAIENKRVSVYLGKWIKREVLGERTTQGTPINTKGRE